jgi:hypothetical protein
MSDRRCPHCGAGLPLVHDAFCSECRGDLDTSVVGVVTSEKLARMDQHNPSQVLPHAVGLSVLLFALLCAAGLLPESLAPGVRALVVTLLFLIAGLAWHKMSNRDQTGGGARNDPRA